MKTRLLVLSFAALCLSAAPAMADLSSLQGVLDGITVGPNPGDSSVNVNTGMIPDGMDKHWHIGGTGGSINTIVIELAGFADTNLFGVYDITNPANLVQVFDGLAAAGAQATLSIKANGDVLVNGVLKGNFGSTWFGYYLDSRPGGNNGGLWYSDTGLNNGEDHMLAYQGKGIDTIQIDGWGAGVWGTEEFALAWEDLKFAVSDKDYNDFVVMVESVYVPVPAAVLLGLLGLGAAGLRLRKFA